MSVLRSDDIESLFRAQREIAAKLAAITKTLPNTDSTYLDVTDAAQRADRAMKKLERVLYFIKIDRIAERITAELAEKTQLEAELRTK
ncbi:MAG: hypothetical protein ACYC3L_01085 [Gemmatimonadaceae bacterium]